MLNITFNQIRLFEAVARNKSFTKAAKELGISQPAVSSQFKKLADSIGDPLIEMVGRKVYLTPVGETTYLKFQTLLEDFDGFYASLKASQQGAIEGELVLSGVAASKYMLPFILAEFLKEYPKVTPTLNIMSITNTIESIKNNHHDLAITGRVFQGTGANYEAFTNQSLTFVVASNHRLGQHKNIPLKTLLTQKLILPHPETIVRQSVEQMFNNEGLKLQPYMECESYELIKQSVIAGLGVGLLPADAYRLEEHTGYLTRLDVTGFPVNENWYYAYNGNKKDLSPAAIAFIDFLHRHPIETHMKQIYGQ
jgi:DNA-binding transcriptional LysR family regulator